MDSNFVCPNCGNSDPLYIGYRNGVPYCRKCITFKTKNKVNVDYKSSGYAPYILNYDLSLEQTCLSNQLVNNFKHHKNSLVHAVCGSGKTEIVLKIISYAITQGMHVGFSVPRRDVIIELYDRFHSIFKDNSIALVYGGHTSSLYGDLICCTTHQLYRYPNYFDLLILDEVDAFPFKGNDVLNSFFLKSVKGNYVMMSATPDEGLLKNFKENGGKIVELYSRFHKYPLPVPSIITGNDYLLKFKIYRLIKHFNKLGKQVFVFTPTINECESLYSFLKLLIKNGDYVHSKRIDRTETIERFRKKKSMYLVTTAVLERGVTVKDLQVIVFHSDHALYDKYSLVQISGRAGRKKDAPEGEVIYLANKVTKEMEESIRDIEVANKNLQNLFQNPNKD